MAALIPDERQPVTFLFPLETQQAIYGTSAATNLVMGHYYNEGYKQGTNTGHRLALGLGKVLGIKFVPHAHGV